MSKLAHEINAQITGDVKLKQMRYADIKYDQATRSDFLASKGVRMTATFAHTVWLNDTSAKNIVFGEAMYDVKRAIIEDVFGEFRPLILEMRSALHDVDTDRLRRILIEMEHQMFVDGM